jgi:gas vesicle protein
MKKLPLLLGALGGALAGYLFNNTTLRKQLTKAKDADQAAKILGKHLSADGKKIATEVQKFMESDEVQKNVKKAKGYVEKQAKEWKKETEKYVAKNAKNVERTARKAVKKGIAKAKKAIR